MLDEMRKVESADHEPQGPKNLPTAHDALQELRLGALDAHLGFATPEQHLPVALHFDPHTTFGVTDTHENDVAHPKHFESVFTVQQDSSFFLDVLRADYRYADLMTPPVISSTVNP